MSRAPGSVVNISSVAGKVSLPHSSAYCAAKHGVVGLTRALALEVADKGVTVNVCPGYVETALTEATFAQRAEIVGVSREMAALAAITATPQKVVLKPEDVVPAVIYLVSAEAAYTTGEALNVSAGLVMH